MNTSVREFGGAQRLDAPEWNVLLQTQRHVPFNNIARIFRHHRQAVLEKLGGDCLYQAHMFRAAMADANPAVRTLLHNHRGAGTDGHVVPVTYGERGTLLHEITELATQPVPLHQLAMGEGQHALVRTFPLMPGRGRMLFAKWMRDCRTLSTVLISESQDWLGRQAAVNMSRALAVPEDERHPFDESMATKPVSQLALHVLGPDGVKSYVALQSSTGDMEAGRIGEGVTGKATHREAGFRDEVTRVARLIGVKRDTLMELFQEGWAYYKAMHPDYADHG